MSRRTHPRRSVSGQKTFRLSRAQLLSWLPNRKANAEEDGSVRTRSSTRVSLVGGIIGVGYLMLVARASSLMLLPDPQLEAKARIQFEEAVEVHGRRGDIVDRHHTLLATTVNLYELHVDPWFLLRSPKADQVHVEDPVELLAGILAEELNIDAAHLAKRFRRPGRRDVRVATELTPAHQASLAEFFQAIINWDGAGVARNIIAFSSNLQPSFDPESFTSDVTTAVRHFQDSTPRAGDCMAAIFETVQRHHVTLDPNVMVAVVTVMVLEGWQFRLDPSINILDYIGDVMRSSFRKHQRLTVMDFGLRDMWAPFSEPNALTMDRSGARPMAWSMQASVDNAGGLWYGSY